MKNSVGILLVSIAAIAAGCATSPQEQGDLCLRCGEVVEVSESSASIDSLANDNLMIANQGAAGALGSIDRAGQSGLASRQSSLNSPLGMPLQRAEQNYEVLLRMSSGARRVILMTRSMARRWEVGDKVKVVGNSLIRQ